MPSACAVLLILSRSSAAFLWIFAGRLSNRSHRPRRGRVRDGQQTLTAAAPGAVGVAHGGKVVGTEQRRGRRRAVPPFRSARAGEMLLERLWRRERRRAGARLGRSCRRRGCRQPGFNRSGRLRVPLRSGRGFARNRRPGLGPRAAWRGRTARRQRLDSGRRGLRRAGLRFGRWRRGRRVRCAERRRLTAALHIHLAVGWVSRRGLGRALRGHLAAIMRNRADGRGSAHGRRRPGAAPRRGPIIGGRWRPIVIARRGTAVTGRRRRRPGIGRRRARIARAHLNRPPGITDDPPRRVQDRLGRPVTVRRVKRLCVAWVDHISGRTRSKDGACNDGAADDPGSRGSPPGASPPGTSPPGTPPAPSGSSPCPSRSAPSWAAPSGAASSPSGAAPLGRRVGRGRAQGRRDHGRREQRRDLFQWYLPPAMRIFSHAPIEPLELDFFRCAGRTKCEETGASGG